MWFLYNLAYATAIIMQQYNTLAAVNQDQRKNNHARNRLKQGSAKSNMHVASLELHHRNLREDSALSLHLQQGSSSL
jgi:hypothetical protein